MHWILILMLLNANSGSTSTTAPFDSWQACMDAGHGATDAWNHLSSGDRSDFACEPTREPKVATIP